MAYQYPYYQPYYQNPAQTPQNQPQSGSGVLWVQGEAGARSWLCAPNTTVLLMDSESERFFLKSTDASGMPLPLRIFDYKERTSQQGTNPVRGGEYVTKAEFEAFKDELLNGRPEKRPSNESSL